MKDMQKSKTAKLILLATLLIAMILMSSVVFPVYATVSAMNISTTIETFRTFEIEGFVVHAKRIDIFKLGQHLIQLEAKVTIDGRVITIKSDPYPFYKLLPQINQRYRIQEQNLAACATQTSLPKYYWDNILFVKAPGSSYYWVKYDHPDNVETYYPMQINKAYTLNGASRQHEHIPRYILEDAKYRSTFVSIAGLLGPIIAGLLLVPELVSKVVAGIIALVGAILALIGYIIRWFIENILQTELYDGWIYTWGYGRLVFWGWTLLAWWYMSFGAWRDWGFFVLI